MDQEFLKGRHIKAGHSTLFLFPCLATHPLRVTRHWRSPSFRKISTTVSMGVWSVTVKGLRFRMRLSFSGCGLLAGSSGGSSVKYMMELLTMPSCLCLAFSRIMVKGGNDKPHTKILYLTPPTCPHTAYQHLTKRSSEGKRHSHNKYFCQTSVNLASLSHTVRGGPCCDKNVHCQHLMRWAPTNMALCGYPQFFPRLQSTPNDQRSFILAFTASQHGLKVMRLRNLISLPSNLSTLIFKNELRSGLNGIMNPRGMRNQ